MNREREILLLLVSLLIVVVGFPAHAQDNPFKIDNELYDRYMNCQKVLKEKRVLAMADTLFHLAARKGDVKAQCLALHVECDHYYYIENIPELSVSIKRMRDFAVNTSYRQYIFSAWGRKLTYYLRNYQYDDALLELNAYQAEAIRLKSTYGILSSYKQQADIYAIRSNNKKAIELYKKAIAYSLESNETRNVYELYQGLGRGFRNNKQLDSAAIYFQKALDTAPIERGKTTIYIELAAVELNCGQPEKAWEYLQQAQRLQKKYPLYGVSYNNYLSILIQYYIARGEFNAALPLTDSITDVVKRAERKRALYKLMGNYEEAFNWSVSYFDLYYKYMNNETSERVAELTSRFDNQRLEAEKNRLALQNSQLKLQQVESDKRLLENKQQLLISEKVRTQLDLDNQKLTMRQQQVELEKSLKETLYQKEVAKTMKLHSRQNFILSVILGVVLVLVIIFFLSYMMLRRRSMIRLEKEKKVAESARLQAEEARRQAENGNRLKSLFLQNMSHEIRTPLNAIVGFTGVLNSGEDVGLTDEERKEMLGLIETNTELLTTLINDILDISKLESGTYTLSLSSVPISDLCHAVLASVAHRVQQDVELRLDEPANTSGLVINTDPARLQQVLTNLLTNACKYTEKGSIILSYHFDGTEWEFIVTDTGSGIPLEKAETIFERFEKLDSFKQGTGLGLNICRRIADLVGGRIYVDTSYTDGARFVFVHPVLS
ncbi:ATP-binding protein [Phocaeicola sp.]